MKIRLLSLSVEACCSKLHPSSSLEDYPVGVLWPGRYGIALTTEDKEFDGHGLIDPEYMYFTVAGDFDRSLLNMYISIKGSPCMLPCMGTRRQW